MMTSKTIYIDTTTAAPELRFPEFHDDWQVKNGDELFDSIVNKNHNSDLPILAITQEQGAVPREMIDYKIAVTDKSIESYKVVEIGDFIISLRSFQGGIEYSNYKGICSPAYIVLRKKSDDISNDFFKYYFKTKRYISELTKNLEGIRDGKMISYKQFSETKIFLPTLPEQRKIALCLSSLDNLIKAVGNKIELLKQHKKGLMQKLFPKKECNVPELRFGGFEGEWEVKRLGECLLEPPDYGLNAPAVPFSKSLPTYIRITDISDNGKFIAKNKASVNTILTGNNILQEGDIVFARTGASVGKVYMYRKNDGILVFAGFLIRIKPNQTQLLSDYLFQFLFTDTYKKWVDIVSMRSGQPGINSLQICNLPIPIPTLSEQRKIASCLSYIDAVIEETENKLQRLQQHKKGLMQRMFVRRL